MTLPEPLTFAAGADGYELSRAGAVVGRVGRVLPGRTRAHAGADAWEIHIDGDRDAFGATWQVLAHDAAGELQARYFHGSVRGGRLRLAGDVVASLRRELGLAVEWRFRMPEAAVTLSPHTDAAGTRLEIAFRHGSVDIPAIVVLLACWIVMAEERVEDARA